jgi:hypothetical protein
MGQRATHSGHKRRNCIKFRAVTAPDGLILLLHGPVEGRRHDMTLYRESNIYEIYMRSYNQRWYYMECNIVCTVTLHTAFGLISKLGSNLNLDQVQFNASMSKVRIAVEWANIKMYFTRVDLPRKLKLGVTLGGQWYISSAVLWNFRGCLICQH